MHTKYALRELGVGPGALSAARRDALDADGYFIVEDVLTPAECRTMAEAFETLHAAEAGRGGHEVHVEPGARRLSNIFNKTGAFDRCLELPSVLAAAHHLLGEIKVHGANIRDPNQGFGAQGLHVDVPKKFADDWWVLNAMLMFDDMTLDNGPTRIVPGSHHWAPINVPYVNIGDWQPQPLTPEDKARVPADVEAPYPGELLVTAPAGSAIICNSSMWHSGTVKRDNTRRRMLHLTYTRRDLPQQLVQIDHLTRGLYDRMGPAHRYLLEIEPSAGGVLRQPNKEHAGWWN